MPVTDAEHDRLKARLSKLENALNDVITAIEQFITLGQMNQLLTIQQQQNEDLETQLLALEDRVTAIEEEPLQ